MHKLVNRKRCFISIECAATFATNSKSSRKSMVGVDGIVSEILHGRVTIENLGLPIVHELN